MAYMITELRGRCNAGTADYSVAGVSYFTDDQLQDVLDSTMTERYQVLLTPMPEIVAGTYVYKKYPVPADVGEWVEDNISGTDFGRLYELNGTAASGATANWKQRRITFSADQQGKEYYLDVRTFNVDAATAKVWRQKAAFLANMVDWESDNHKIKAGQEYEHCIKMAEQYEKKKGITVGRTFRADQNPAGW